MIRFCNGEVYNCNLNNISRGEIITFFLDGHIDDLVQVVDDAGRFQGILRYYEIMNSEHLDYVMDRTKVILDENVFENAKKRFLSYKKEYIPVVNADGMLECFCYNDPGMDCVLYDYLDLLLVPGITNTLFKDYDGVEICGINEIAIRLMKYLEAAEIEYNLYGRFWENVRPGYINREFKNSYKIRVEGNEGLEIEDLAFWKLNFPGREYDMLIKQIDNMKAELKEDNCMSIKQGNQTLYDMILSGKPFMAARLGHTESRIAMESLHGCYEKNWLNWLYTTSGFFSENQQWNLQDVECYAKRTIEAIGECDIHMCEFAFQSVLPLLQLFSASNLQKSMVDWNEMLCVDLDIPFWAQALEGKKVLVVSAQTDTIKEQYAKRELVWRGRNVLPQFELITLKAYETYGQGYKNYDFVNWFEAYDSLLEKVKNIDFDVALIGAGSYGYPLAADIKKMGRQSIELCSFLLPLFGIKMKPHSNRYWINQYWNEYWTFSIDEPVGGYRKIENGCYWK